LLGVGAGKEKAFAAFNDPRDPFTYRDLCITGWQQYTFMNPATQAVEEKVAYFERVDDGIVSCGAYRR
jgi:hypothetical protein